jgi:hypothetical protein
MNKFKRIPGSNIFTEMISDELGISLDVAMKVQDYMSTYFDFDWSEATQAEINFYAHVAFENMNAYMHVDSF